MKEVGRLGGVYFLGAANSTGGVGKTDDPDGGSAKSKKKKTVLVERSCNKGPQQKRSQRSEERQGAPSVGKIRVEALVNFYEENEAKKKKRFLGRGVSHPGGEKELVRGIA